MTKIFKFGGASIKDANGFRNVAQIVAKYKDENLVLVVSALGKTTNALELVINAYMAGNTAQAFENLEIVKNKHQAIIQELFPKGHTTLEQEINDLFVDIEWIIEEPMRLEFDYTYDQIVSVGELLSTKILAAVLQDLYAIGNYWLDARDCIRTDNTYRDAKVQWQETAQLIRQQMAQINKQKNIVLTQGFIGNTDENFTTTLGREGSDYTAAIFAYCLDAESLTIWKDVAGVLTADPNLLPEYATLLSQLSYQEAIEMTYYGAKVIHPNTLRPLENKQIPLFVRSFINFNEEGTMVFGKISSPEQIYPPIIVVKENQALLKVRTKDLHFLDEIRLAQLFQLLATARIKINMIQNTALAFSLAIDYNENRLAQFIEQAQTNYDIEVIPQLTLLTLRYASEELQAQFTAGKEVYLYEHIGIHHQLLVNN